jgi:hypothetical protein
MRPRFSTFICGPILKTQVIIRVDVELLPEAHKLSEFPSREKAEAFAEIAAITFQNAGMIVVYDHY